MSQQRTRITHICGGVAAMAIATALGLFTLGRAESAAAPAGQPAPTPAPSAAPGASNAPAAQVEVQNDAPTTAPNVKIVIRTLPSNIVVNIKWGNKKLGIIKPKTSLTVERPRDSGPMDLMLTSQGYLTVHTRAYTFNNSVVIVKMTPIDKKNTLYGYREELPPEADGGVPLGGPDAGGGVGSP